MSITSAYISSDNVIGDAAQELRDLGFGKLGKPFYESACQRALQDLGYDTFFDRKAWDAPIPPDLTLDLPDGVIGLEMANLFNGGSCDISKSAVLFIKPNMYRKGPVGYLANNTWNNHDTEQYSNWSCEPYLGPFGNGVFYAGEFNGKLFLSNSCLAYEKIHLTYNGLGVDCWGAEFKVPQWAREAVTDYIILKAARALQQGNMQYYRAVIADKNAEMKNLNGTWLRARMRWKTMDKKQRYDSVCYTFGFGRFP